MDFYNVGHCVKFERAVHKIDCLTSVKNVHSTWVGDFISTFDHSLHIFGKTLAGSRHLCQEMSPELSYLCSNVKLIGGDENLCFYITMDHELYYLDYTDQHQLESIFVAKNVKQALATPNGRAALPWRPEPPREVWAGILI